jgi:hypothetical protein
MKCTLGAMMTGSSFQKFLLWDINTYQQTARQLGDFLCLLLFLTDFPKLCLCDLLPVWMPPFTADR